MLLVKARAAMSQWILKTLYVFLQRTDTQKTPAARKQADMTMYSLKRGISAADRKPSGFFSRIMTVMSNGCSWPGTELWQLWKLRLYWPSSALEPITTWKLKL